MIKIAIANRKGGTAKTTTAVHLAAGLAQAGRKVLLIDTDAQGHCSMLLGVSPPAGLAEVIVGSTTLDEAISECRDRLYLLSGSRELAGAQREIARRSVRPEMALTEALADLAGFDYIIVDTAPSISELAINVLFFCETALVPVSMEFLSFDGLRNLEAELAAVRRYSDIRIGHIVPTYVDGRLKRSEAILDSLRVKYPDLTRQEVHTSARIAELPALGKTIWEYSPRSRAAREYARLCGDVDGQR